MKIRRVGAALVIGSTWALTGCVLAVPAAIVGGALTATTSVISGTAKLASGAVSGSKTAAQNSVAESSAKSTQAAVDAANSQAAQLGQTAHQQTGYGASQQAGRGQASQCATAPGVSACQQADATPFIVAGAAVATTAIVAAANRKPAPEPSSCTASCRGTSYRVRCPAPSMPVCDCGSQPIAQCVAPPVEP